MRLLPIFSNPASLSSGPSNLTEPSGQSNKSVVLINFLLSSIKSSNEGARLGCDRIGKTQPTAKGVVSEENGGSGKPGIMKDGRVSASNMVPKTIDTLCVFVGWRGVWSAGS